MMNVEAVEHGGQPAAVPEIKRGGGMDINMNRNALAKLSGPQKKELFGILAASLFKDFSETEKKDLLQKIITGGKTNLQVIDMVEH